MIRAAAALGLLAAVVAATGTAAGAAPSQLRLTVTATLEERAVYRLTGDSACLWTARGIAVRHLDIASARPLAVQRAQLERGVGIRLEVREIRLANHNAVVGACPRLGPEVSDPSDLCGTRHYLVPAHDVQVRLVADGRLAFSFTRVDHDPYRGRCAPAVWGPTPLAGRSGTFSKLHFPPKRATAPLTGPADRRRARWRGSVTTDQPTFGRTDVATGSWQATLALRAG